VDVIWNVSSAITRARIDRDGAGSAAPQLVVPVGAHFERIARKSLRQAAAHRIAFMGYLLEKQGLQMAIEALPAVRAVIPDASLLVLGDGPYAGELKRLASTLNLSDAVEFTGFIDDHVAIENRLAESAVALATYVPDPNSFTRYADPGKLKTYLACGLPVVMTDVPEFARIVEEAGAGRVVAYNSTDIASALVSYLSDPVTLDLARTAASTLGQGFAWGRIFGDALTQTAAIIDGPHDGEASRASIQ